MSGRVAVVTGASRGAGRGIAAALAAKGWRVYATGRSITDAPPGGVAVRVDHADDDAVARRTGLPRGDVSELLLDAEAFGWVTRVEFGDSRGWALTDRGRAQDGRMRAAVCGTDKGEAWRVTVAAAAVDQALAQGWRRVEPGQEITQMACR